MIRTIIRPTKSEITLQLPEEYIGKDVELIAFTKEETEIDFKQKEFHLP
jgi:hypothetical protein